MKHLAVVAILIFLALSIQPTPYAGIFKMEYDAEFMQYRFPNQKGALQVPLNEITLEVGYLSRDRKLNQPWSERRTRGALGIINGGMVVEVVILDFAFVEKVNGSDGRIFRPIDVHDHEISYGRKPKIHFPQTYRRLPVVWTQESGRYISMDFPPIPEDIKEGEILVKLKIVSPQGEENFERRFPVYQKTFVGKKRIID